jgi:hypothetical protein
LKAIPHPFSVTETFLHELKHAVDVAYAKLDRDKSSGFNPLNEFDAITFAGEARRQIEIYQGKEPVPSRDSQVYGYEDNINENPSIYNNLHPELEIATGYRILKERGISVTTEDGKEIDGAEWLYEQNPETTFHVTTPDGKSTFFRDMVSREKHNTAIYGKSIK